MPVVYLIVLLIDERPEEGTDMEEQSARGGDSPPPSTSRRTGMSRWPEMVIEKATRLVGARAGTVVILLDSIHPAARAVTTSPYPHSGKLLSGGVDAYALHKPSGFFGAARNIERGRLPTIIATALGGHREPHETDVIFEDFNGDGNMEPVLDRHISDKRIFQPSTSTVRDRREGSSSSTRDPSSNRGHLTELPSDMPPTEAINFLGTDAPFTCANQEFMDSMQAG